MSIDSAMPDGLLARLWREINWYKYDAALLSYQRDIALATLRKNPASVLAAQKQLVQSIEAKAVAVRHVCSSVAQPGPDGVKWIKDAEKMRAANTLNPPNYIARPARLIVISRKGLNKERRIQIPNYFDRAMQTLYAYALDPVSESTSDKKSFAFRKGRSPLDVHAFIMRTFSSRNPPRYALKTDVKACYGSISHSWLLRNILMDKNILYQFLRAGYVLNGTLFPPEDTGIALGSSLSPILGNMTLNGMQTAIYQGLYGEHAKPIDYIDGDIIRYADDMIITATTREAAEKIKEILTAFLAIRGLRLSEPKTHIINTAEGFIFMGRHYRYINDTFIGEPSEEAISRMTQKMRELITPYRGGQKKLIDTINKKLTGWATYYKCTDAQAAFRHIDTVIRALLLDLCEKLHPKLSRLKILEKYFYYMEPDGTRSYVLEDKPDIRIHRLADTLLVQHHPLAISMNPYLDTDYFEDRTNSQAIRSITGKYRAIWERQNGNCFYCGNDILIDHEKRIIPINPADPEVSGNMAYVHEYCASGTAELYISENNIETGFDIHQLLTEMTDRTFKGYKHYRLTNYFRHRNEPLVTLSFAEIEKILGHQLCESAYTHLNYWHSRGPQNISRCWISNGYDIRRVDMVKRTLVFERSNNLDGLTSIAIPPVLLNGRIPKKAAIELDTFFEHLIKKYGLNKNAI